MKRHSSTARRLRLAMPLAGLCSLAAVAAPEALPRFATQPSAPIDCAATPFGMQVTLGYEYEAIHLLAAGGYNAIEEYQPGPGPDPLVRSFQDGLYPGALAGSVFLKAVAADLDGDGRDEVVTANRTAGGSLRLGVFARTSAPAAELVDTWTLDLPFSSVALVAADLDGSLDDQVELGVLVRPNSGGMRLHVLRGGAGGVIAHGDNASAGSWSRAQSPGEFDLAAGDVLLDGRAQLIVVNEADGGPNRRFDFHLLEFQPTTAQLPVAGGDTAIGSKTFQSPLGTVYEHDNGSADLDDIHRIEADAGDVVDGAAAELVVHTQFRGGSVEYIGRRLHHFTVERTAGVITGIGLANRNQGGETGREYDSSRLVPGASETAPVNFEVAIADIDRRPPSEMVIARAEYDNKLLVEGYRAEVDLVAGFKWRANGLTVTFTNTTTGEYAASSWTFGDGATSTQRSPSHTFADTTDRTVTLTVTGADGTQRSVNWLVDVGSTSTGGEQPGYMYHMDDDPTYKGMRTVNSAQDLHFVNVATGDLDRDGRAEILTLARDAGDEVLRSVWHVASTPPGQPPYPIDGLHQFDTDNAFNSMTAMDLVAADFDGDTIKALIGTDCRRVHEPQVHQLVWMPPYFARLQASQEMAAAFGQTVGGAQSTEHRFGSYSSHDFSAYIGVGLGSDAVGVKASVHATAGYNYQTATGQTHGTENSFEINTGYSQEDGEALVIFEEYAYNCYGYDVFWDSEAPFEPSTARLCEIDRDTRSVHGSHAREWATAIPAALPDHPPAQWVPLQREWSSVSLFRPVSSNVTAFEPNSGPDMATDGRFDTAAVSASAPAQPWLQIDLGSVRDISAIRVFPLAGEAGSLQGFRLYASAQPMTGDGVPGGAQVRSYAPETEDGAGYDRWNIFTRERTSPYAMLKARYLRLQNPDAGSQPQALRVAEVQVFGDVHVDPPAFPAMVCDQNANDEFFQVDVWNALEGKFRRIDVHGDLLWSGAQDLDPGGSCATGVNVANIWSGNSIGSPSTLTWDMSNTGTTLIGTDVSFDSSTRVGAEFDIEAGFIATLQAGGAYEYTTGVTEETQNTTYWTQGLQMGGEMSGFAPEYSALAADCSYGARPYAFRLKDRSNTGYQHDIYVVDYIVPDGNGTVWDRDDVSVECTHGDAIFKDGFD